MSTEPVSILSSLLEEADITALRKDVANWKAILAKNSVNVLIAFRRPDQTVDVSRREGLLHMLVVLEHLLAEHDRNKGA